MIPTHPSRWLDTSLPYPKTLVYIAVVVTLVAVLEIIQLIVG